MADPCYIMESEEEAIRLDLKTDPEGIKRQALWAGLSTGMRVADLGCGPGKTSFHLNQLIRPGGSVLGVDISQQRIRYALSHYKDDGLQFLLGDIRKPLHHLGEFDFIWVRFVLEHYRAKAFNIVENISKILKRGGILCLVDLDLNCLNYYGIPPRLESAIFGVMDILQQKRDFDPYAGRKLYSFLYDLEFEDIRVELSAHHLLFGPLTENEQYNWRKKVEIAARNSGYPFSEYEDGVDGFQRESDMFFSNPRRFAYTPIIVCRGRKP
jgi:SAM-dependent methyltransferase